MAVHDAAEFLKPALDSVLAQSFTDFELLVVDDGSRDATAEILSAYTDSRLRVLRFTENRGLVEALNAGLEQARAPLVARMDGDDVAEPERLRLQVEFMRTHPDVVLLGTSFTYIDHAGRGYRTMSVCTELDRLQSRLMSANQFCHPSVMMRAEVVREVGAYRSIAGRAAQDYDLWLRLAERGAIANLAEPLLRYRVHGRQVSISKLESQRQAANLYRALAEQRRRGETEDVERARRSALLSHSEMRRAVVEDYLGWAALYESMEQRTLARGLLLRALKFAPGNLELLSAMLRLLPGGSRLGVAGRHVRWYRRRMIELLTPRTGRRG